jgi:hypothetical protein
MQTKPVDRLQDIQAGHAHTTIKQISPEAVIA